jgi:hypothetical protein
VLKIHIRDVDGNQYNTVQIPLKQVYKWRDIKILLADEEIRDDLFIKSVERLYDDDLFEEMNNHGIIPCDAGDKPVFALCSLYHIK